MTPVPSNGKTVLITGLNGYVAGHIGLLALAKGYSIHGTVRSVSAADGLLSGAFAPYVDRVKIFHVPDITEEGAFDEATKGAFLSLRAQLAEN